MRPKPAPEKFVIFQTNPRCPLTARVRRLSFNWPQAVAGDTIAKAFLIRHHVMQRRDFLKIAGVAAAGSRLIGQQTQSFLAPAGAQDAAKTDFTLQIGPVTVEL